MTDAAALAEQIRAEARKAHGGKFYDRAAEGSVSYYDADSLLALADQVEQLHPTKPPCDKDDHG